ncbi:hypothetical protein GGQ22_08920 [Nocardioides sp. zg-579]|uniref:Uncharacterized protein n=1 Tax=Nocardioides marmotae TaxID=2663857 RepID=A0A6I3JAS0_9ACTN|nr:hypothetical protein [Nocardioides marmotae]MCR6031568.1 hypothetical protein [Gordonia jinghuaiqii]MTB95207.1 hypothetical protein [Nocardioides marmotae]QKE02312.1 hypothetical protein HPC71_15475 [Nocardioides marmotae]
MPSRYADLSRAQLAALVPELLLIGQLIDRSGMAWCISAFGREEMAQIAIEEWAAASPIYTRRMQQALGYAGPPDEGDVVTIFKGLQLDIGAPPQFMDFRYTVHDRWSGEFHLDHCGALMDVEPMGPDYVRSMCHTIEDPTFDATAVATNPRAQVRPIHRPPRVPAGRTPHCAWTVRIDPAHPPVEGIPALAVNARSRAASLELDPIDPREEGAADYAGPLVDDLDFSAFSHSALVRIADEVCLQMHLLDLAFLLAVRARAGDDEAGRAQLRTIATKQLVGIAGVAAGRIRRALDLPADAGGALEVLRLHPLLNPAAYVEASFGAATLTVAPSAAHEDGAWLALVGPGSPEPLRAAVRGVSPLLDVEVTGAEQTWTATVVTREEPAREHDEVAVTRISTGADFAFEPRRSLPIFSVQGAPA